MIGLVWAQSANGVIGRDGTLPWHLPEDLKHFRSLTAGAAVLMGRRTWESLPPRFVSRTTTVSVSGSPPGWRPGLAEAVPTNSRRMFGCSRKSLVPAP